jgi:NADH-quinone oxidoreductase subunit L
MLGLLWLILAACLAGFVVLAVVGGRLSRRGVVAVGVGAVGLSTLIAIGVAAEFLANRTTEPGYSQVLWRWMAVPGFETRIGLYLDGLALLMTLVVTVVGLLIHVYAAEFMRDEEGYSRFFAYMNLFVASMLTLVLADNLLLLYLGWEGVGLCSYLLIGFWYTDPANGAAAQKAFIVTRIGDTAMALGLFLLATRLGTLEIQPLMQRAAEMWPVGSGPAVAAAALLLGGALGKSAQLPLQTWLPDAMAGPTPVSALIHAATMVTAGVYLIARTHVFFALAPAVQLLVGVIGAATLLVAAMSALVQRDIKRVLAYSTISQIGYMFLALGVGAPGAAMFHFMTHACFKALLFLAAGVVIQALHHEHDIFRMGGLRTRLPLAFWTFLVGGASLAGLPVVTAGFYSKDRILTQAWLSGGMGHWLWAAGWIGALLTALYIFRVVFIVFFGEGGAPVEKRPGNSIRIPLVILAVLALTVGLLGEPRLFGGVDLFSRLLSGALPAVAETSGEAGAERILQALATAASLGGILLAYALFLPGRRLVDALTRTRLGGALHRCWFQGWGFDWLYERLLIRPFVWVARANRQDMLDLPFRGVARLSFWCYGVLRGSQTGRLRWYATAIAAGSVAIVAIVLLR